MHDRLRQIVDEYETLEAQLSDAEVLADPDRLRTLSKRYTELGPVVETVRRRDARAADADAARSMLPDDRVPSAIFSSARSTMSTPSWPNSTTSSAS